MRRTIVTAGFVIAFLTIPTVAFACGGLVSPNGAVNLAKTTTLAAYVDGVERYITAFTFTGAGGGKFGSIVPLPGEPTDVERAGDWTLQRLVQEVTPPAPVADAGLSAARSLASAEVILETRIDALDLTVVKGGAAEVARWATDEGFVLSPDAPEVLEFYANRSPYFMAARFDAREAARLGQTAGDGTPIMVTIPTDDPWVPLRILGLGKQPGEPVQADVFLLTERAPTMLPAPRGQGNPAGLPTAGGLEQLRSEPASKRLLADLRSDKNMGWLPARGLHFTYVKVATQAGRLGHDLAIDASGSGSPDWVDAGFPVGVLEAGRGIGAALAWAFAALAAVLAARTIWDRRRIGATI